MLDNTTKSWAGINDSSRGTYNNNSHIKFNTTIFKPSLYNYSDVYILVKGTITITGELDDGEVKQEDERDKDIIFKNCGSLTGKTM